MVDSITETQSLSPTVDTKTELSDIKETNKPPSNSNTVRVDNRPHTFEEAVQRTIEDTEEKQKKLKGAKLHTSETPSSFAEGMIDIDKRIKAIINKGK